MTLHIDRIDSGVIRIVLTNDRKTILLVFFLDYRSGKAHTNLEDGGLLYGTDGPTEEDVRAYATYFYNVLGNGVAELICEELEPVDCEVVIPVNIIPPNPTEAIQEALERYRSEKAARSDGQTRE
ncbi:hypothetical protein D9M68_829660 [compost metagenome]